MEKLILPRLVELETQNFRSIIEFFTSGDRKNVTPLQTVTLTGLSGQTMVLSKFPKHFSSSTGIPRRAKGARPLQPNSALQRNFQRFTHRAIDSLAHKIGGGRTKLVGAHARQSLIGRNEEGKRCSRLCQRIGK